MGSVNGYLLTVISVGIFLGLAVKASHPTLSSVVEGCAGIILVLVLLEPLLGLLSADELQGSLAPDTPLLGSPEYVEVAASAMEEGIRSDIAERFSISTEEVRVECRELDVYKMRCLYILVELECSPFVADFPRIRSHVLENYAMDEGGECDVRWIYE